MNAKLTTALALSAALLCSLNVSAKTYYTLPTTKFFSADKLKVPKPKTETLSTGVRLSWSPSVGAIGYRIYRGTKNNWKSSGKIAQTISVEFLDKTAKPGVDYYYWVCPVAWPKKISISQIYSIEASTKKMKKWLKKGVISSKASKFKTKSTLGWRAVAMTFPNMESYVHGDPETSRMAKYNTSIDGISVSWKKAKGAVKYIVYRLEDSQARKNYLSWRNVKSIVKTKNTSFIDKTAKAACDYRYWVVPIGKNGKNYLDIIKEKNSALNDTPFPNLYGIGRRKSSVDGHVPTPTGSLGADCAGINIHFNYDPYVKSFRLYRSRYYTVSPLEDASLIQTSSNGQGGSITFFDYSLSPNTTYYYWIGVVDIWGTTWYNCSKYVTVSTF